MTKGNAVTVVGSITSLLTAPASPFHFTLFTIQSPAASLTHDGPDQADTEAGASVIRDPYRP